MATLGSLSWGGQLQTAGQKLLDAGVSPQEQLCCWMDPGCLHSPSGSTSTPRILTPTALIPSWKQLCTPCLVTMRGAHRLLPILQTKGTFFSRIPADLDILTHTQRSFSEFCQETPFCTTLSYSKAQTHLQRPPFAASLFCGRQRKSVVESSDEPKSVFSFWIRLLIIP